MKKIVVLLVIVSFLTGCKSKINTYDTKMVCKQKFSEDLDGDVIDSESIIYVDYDDKEYVTKAIYQSISSKDYYNSSLIETLDYVITTYNKMDGISARRYNADDKLIFEITYDYKKISLSEFRGSMGDLIDPESVLGSSDELPIKLSDYKKIELDGYECEEK